MAYLLHQLLSESAAKLPENTAVACSGERMSYAVLERESSDFARQLLDLGVEKGDRVGLYLAKSLDSMVAVCGILKTGAAYVPLNTLAPTSYLEYIIDHCGIKTLVTEQAKLETITEITARDTLLERVVVMDGAEPDTEPGKPRMFARSKERPTDSPRAASDNLTDGDVAYILFTSGSTGQPKGVTISHLNSLTFVNMAHDFFGIDERDVIANHAPLHFDLSVFDLFVAFKAGACVTIVPELASNFPSVLAEFIASSKITVWNSVPSVLSLLVSYAKLERFDLSSLRLIVFSGEVFPLKHLRRLKDALPSARLYNVYGQTEANSSMYFPVDELPADDSQAIPIGKPFPNFEVFAIDEEGRRIREAGETGELYVRSASVALGYWGDPTRTNQSFVGNPLHTNFRETVYKTGDRVALDHDGNYLFLGRADHLFKSRGYRIEVGEIETAIRGYPGVKTGVVIPIPDELIGNKIAAVVVGEEPGKLEKREIIEHCHDRLPKYMIPEILEFRDSLPTTSSGKTDRKTLLQELTSQTDQ